MTKIKINNELINVAIANNMCLLYCLSYNTVEKYKK